MRDFKKIITVVSISLVSGTAFAGVDSRSVSMGDTGAASSDYMAAVFSNPALGAMRPTDAHFGAIIPFVSGNMSDKDDLLNKVSNFQDLTAKMGDDYSNGDGGKSLSTKDRDLWKKNIADIMKSQHGVNANLTSGVALSFPYGADSTNTLFVKTNILGQVKQHVNHGEADLSDFIKHKVAGADGFKDSDVTLRAVAVTDFGVSIARRIRMPHGELYVGFTPKMQQIAATRYDAQVDTFDAHDFKPLDGMEKQIKYNFDAGVAYSFRHWTIGYYAHNIMKRQLVVGSGDHAEIYKVTPSNVLGIAYSDHGLTATADIDLMAENTVFGEKTKYAKFGVEYNLRNWVQLRAGYKSDLVGKQNVESVGFGFKPFGKLGVDIAAQKTGDDNYGGSLQFVLNI